MPTVISDASVLIDRLIHRHGFRLSLALCQQLLKQAGEVS